MMKQHRKNFFESKLSDAFHGKFGLLVLIPLCMIVTFPIFQRYTFAAEMPQPVSAFEASTFHDNQGGVLPYRLLKPIAEDLAGPKKYPLILFLHGTGERGSDNKKQLKYIAEVFEQPALRQKYPCFVMVPQCPAGQNWVEKESYSGTVPISPKPAKPLWQTMELLHGLQNELPVDSNRIYIIGVSSGGSGVWDLIARYPHMFAAAAPFCGSGDDQKANLMVDTPIWAFHGGRDILVNPNTTRAMIKAILKAGGHPRYTEYPNLFHNIWNKAFHDPAFFEWLFQQKRE
ncbi:MAG TPA: phospholipase [Firmicutes bacterium]|jgi:predicted peptidase|nr:phospholipase [Bacillota bacterium]